MRLVTEPVGRPCIRPVCYTSGDVAEAFARALDQPVEPDVIPRNEWVTAYAELRFSPPAAPSHAGMTALSVEGNCDMPGRPKRGNTTLRAYTATLVDDLEN